MTTIIVISSRPKNQKDGSHKGQRQKETVTPQCPGKANQ